MTPRYRAEAVLASRQKAPRCGKPCNAPTHTSPRPCVRAAGHIDRRCFATPGVARMLDEKMRSKEAPALARGLIAAEDTSAAIRTAIGGSGDERALRDSLDKAEAYGVGMVKVPCSTLRAIFVALDTWKEATATGKRVGAKG